MLEQGYQLFPVVYFSWGALPTKKGVRKGTTGGPRHPTPVHVAAVLKADFPFKGAIWSVPWQSGQEGNRVCVCVCVTPS